MRYAVLFDFNGVLVDDEPLHFEAARRALADEGFELTEEEYYGPLFGLSDDLFFREFLGRRSIANDELAISLVARKSVIYPELIAGASLLFDGVRELVSDLRNKAVLGIVSAAPRYEIELILEEHGLLEPFSFVVSSDEIAHHKPHPEPYELALKHIESVCAGFARSRVVAIEDSPAGIRSAKAAGIKVIAVAHYLDESDLAQADVVVERISKVSPELIESLVFA